MADALTHSAAEVLQWLLIDQALGTDPADDGDWPVFSVNEPDDPEELIVVRDVSGRIDGFQMTEGDAIEYHGFQLIVRSNDWRSGFQKRDAIKQALDNDVNLTEVVTPSSVTQASYVVYSVTRTSTPILSPRPEDKRYSFIINGLVRYAQL